VNIRRMVLGGTLAGSLVLAVSAGPAAAAQSDSGTDPKPVGTSVRPGDSRAPDRMGGATAAVAPAARSAEVKIQRLIAAYVAKHGTAHSFATYLNATTAKLVVESDAPVSLVSELTDLSRVAGASAAEKQAAKQVSVRRTSTSDQFHRRDDAPPFWGGAGLSAGGALCSSGYAVRNAAGTVFMTTAGHCYNVGTTVRTESGARVYGVVSNRHLPTFNGQPRDVELLGGQSYAGRIYTGGVTSTTSVPVFAAGEAVVGFNNYCHSGRTTGEHCGHTAVDINGQVCTATGCKSPVIVFRGGVLSQGGDSGSPFYVMDSSGRAWIRGHVIAGNGVDTSYAEKWTAIAPLLGVSIVTG
jgi:hypothetical protein